MWLKCLKTFQPAKLSFWAQRSGAEKSKNNCILRDSSFHNASQNSILKDSFTALNITHKSHKFSLMKYSEDHIRRESKIFKN